MTGAGDLFLAIDGGGTKTSAVLVDRTGRIVATAAGPTSNPSVTGFDRAAAVLSDLIGQVTRQAGPDRQIERGWIGLSGFGRASDRDRLRPILEPLVPNLTLTNDIELVLGALPRSTGVALIAGTGSIAAGRNQAGDFVRVGGWGHLFGDEGSGYDIGRRALRAIAAEIDGRGPKTEITRHIFDHWQITEPFDLIIRAYDQATDKAAIAYLARFPLDLAFHKDEVAMGIVEEAATDLASLVDTAARRLGFTEDLPLVLAGGIMVHYLVIREPVLARLSERWRIVDPLVVVDPALSAARGLAGHWGLPR